FQKQSFLDNCLTQSGFRNQFFLEVRGLKGHAKSTAYEFPRRDGKELLRKNCWLILSSEDILE
uniref:Uncharacterized protein n=1 Tax=Loxodonta africana TaxID=9785 RepID=G3TX52_LOXAF